MLDAFIASYIQSGITFSSLNHSNKKLLYKSITLQIQAIFHLKSTALNFSLNSINNTNYELTSNDRLLPLYPLTSLCNFSCIINMS